MNRNSLKITTAKQAFISSGVLCSLYLGACGLANNDLTVLLCSLVVALTGIYLMIATPVAQPATIDTNH